MCKVGQCNITYQVTSGSILGVTASSGGDSFLSTYMWYLVGGAVVIVLCVCGICFYSKKKGESHEEVWGMRKKEKTWIDDLFKFCQF
jgi:hypothetical protein